MSRSFTKLFSSITESTVWCEPLATRVCWIAMLAMADRHGRVWASVPGLANRARISIKETATALDRFLAPDPYSRTPDHEGRRIEVIDGGWRLLNYAKYRALRDEEDRREYQLAWDRQHRSGRSRNPTNPTNPTKSDRDRPAPTQAEADAEAETSTPLSGVPPDGVRVAEQSPNAKAKREARAAAQRALTYLNERAGTRFRPTEPNLKLPMARILYDGASEEDLQSVVDLKVAEAKKGEFDRKYLRPATLWNGEKFAQYVGQVNTRVPAKRDEGVRVFAVTEGGERHFVTDYPPGTAEDAARRALADYGAVPWMRRTRNLVVRVNGSESMFSLEELRRAH